MQHSSLLPTFPKGPILTTQGSEGTVIIDKGGLLMTISIHMDIISSPPKWGGNAGYRAAFFWRGSQITSSQAAIVTT
eukprot:4492450-Pyramimonas_sp.AAC.1